MIKVSFSDGGNSHLDAKRGIGANTEELVNELTKFKNIEIVNNLTEADIVHFTKFRPFFIDLPFSKQVNQKWVLTIHDLIPLIYPKHYPSGIKGKIKFLINKFIVKNKVDAILTISETSKKDICRFLGVKPEKVFVSYIAPKSAIKKLSNGKWSDEIRKKYNLPLKFILFDHGVNYNKNVPTLIKACKKVGIKLAIVGKETENIGKFNLGNNNILKGPKDIIRNIFGIQHPQVTHLEEVKKELESDSVIKLGYVSDEDLNKLFNMATIYVQPSYYEGFGMPVIEAMKVGTPVIASKTQALVEVGGDACLYFYPYSVDDLVEKIKTLLKSEKLREKLISSGYKQASLYSWQKCSNETVKIYYQIIK